jgi:hypothetical protein
MRKTIIASLLALTTASVSALEVSAIGSNAYTDVIDRGSGGIMVTQRFGNLSVASGVEQFTKGTNDQNRFSVVGGYDVQKLGPFTFTAKLGGAYLDNQVGASGYAAVIGLGASAAVTKNIGVNLVAARQYGQDRVTASDGTYLTMGLGYKF